MQSGRTAHTWGWGDIGTLELAGGNVQCGSAVGQSGTQSHCLTWRLTPRCPPREWTTCGHIEPVRALSRQRDAQRSPEAGRKLSVHPRSDASVHTGECHLAVKRGEALTLDNVAGP